MPTLIFDEIKTNMTNADLPKKIALVSALQDVPGWRNDSIKVPQYVIDFIVECSKYQDGILKRTTVRTAIIRFDLDNIRFRPFIESFVEESDMNKIFVCQIIEPNNCPDNEFDLSLIKLCSKTNSLNVIGWLLRIIGGKLHFSNIDKHALILHSLKMIRKWSTIGQFPNIGTEYMINNIGETNIKLAMDFVENWINEETNESTITFMIPKTVYELFQDNEPALIDRTSSWKEKGEKFRRVWFLTIRKTLDEIYHFSNHQFNVETTLCKLLHLSKKEKEKFW